MYFEFDFKVLQSILYFLENLISTYRDQSVQWLLKFCTEELCILSIWVIHKKECHEHKTADRIHSTMNYTTLYTHEKLN